jgi:K+-sensing histidine kinase KdpD
MPRAITSTCFKPFIHGLDVMLAKAERLVARERVEPDSHFGKIGEHHDLVNLPGVAEQVATDNEAAAEARSVHLFVDVAPDALVIGDSHDLHRVVEQLVAQALANTPRGGCVTISGEVAYGVVTLTFSSHRPAIQAANLSRLSPRLDATRCDPFPQSRFFPGEVGQILRAHHGRMEVSDRPGQGPHCVVRLPVG